MHCSITWEGMWSHAWPWDGVTGRVQAVVMNIKGGGGGGGGGGGLFIACRVRAVSCRH